MPNFQVENNVIALNNMTPRFRVGDIFECSDSSYHYVGVIKEIDEDNQVTIEWIVGDGDTHGWGIPQVNERLKSIWKLVPPVMAVMYEI